MPSCAGFLKPKKSRLGPSKSTLKVSHAASPCLSQLISAQCALAMCLAARNRQKIHKTPYFGVQGHQRSYEFDGNREPVYDFLLVINSNLDSISHRYWDTATYWLKIANFSYHLSFSALDRGDPVRIYGKALRFLKLEFSRQPKVKIWWFELTLFLTDPPV